MKQSFKTSLLKKLLRLRILKYIIDGSEENKYNPQIVLIPYIVVDKLEIVKCNMSFIKLWDLFSCAFVFENQ